MTMKINISIEVVGDRVVSKCDSFGLTIDAETLKQSIEDLNEAIQRQIFLDVQSGKYKISDPDIVRFIGGDDGVSGVDFDFCQIAHDLYMEKIEGLMRKYYPSILDEAMWHMLVPRHSVDACEDTDAKEHNAYDDLEHPRGYPLAQRSS